MCFQPTHSVTPNGGGATFAAAALLLAACSFDSSVNEQYGCGTCEPPFECHLDFCVHPAGLEPSPPGAHTDAAPQVDAAAADSGRTPQDAATGADAQTAACREGEVEACYDGPLGTLGRGRCAAGRRTCRSGGWSACRGPQLPEDERCNGADDDCDGSIDEGFDPSSDPDHCGACDRACASGEACCAGVCVDTREDTAHCGGCGQVCDAGNACCGGVCADTQSDPKHCGPSCSPCGRDQGCCDGACTDLTTHRNCGACGERCDLDTELCCQATCTTDLELCAL